MRDVCIYEQLIKFLVFVASKGNMIFSFVSFKWQLDTCFSRTSGCNDSCLHGRNKHVQKKMFGPIEFSGILIFCIDSTSEKQEFLAEISLKVCGVPEDSWRRARQLPIL